MSLKCRITGVKNITKGAVLKFFIFLFIFTSLVALAQDDHNHNLGIDPNINNSTTLSDTIGPNHEENNANSEDPSIEESGSTCHHSSEKVKPTKEELKMARKELWKKCATKDANACFALGMLYRNIDKNDKLGNRYLGKACKMKNSEACFHYAIALEKTNYRATKNILIRECKKGSSKSCRRIGGYLKKDKDVNGAKKYFDVGCTQGDAKSCHEYAMLLTKKEDQILALGENCTSRDYNFSCRILAILEK